MPTDSQTETQAAFAARAPRCVTRTAADETEVEFDDLVPDATPLRAPPPPVLESQFGSRAELKEAVREVLLELLGASAAPVTQAEPMDPRKLLTTDEVAALLRTTRKAVFDKIARGTLPGVRRVGRRILVCQGDLLRSMSEGRVSSPRRSGR